MAGNEINWLEVLSVLIYGEKQHQQRGGGMKIAIFLLPEQKPTYGNFPSSQNIDCSSGKVKQMNVHLS